MEQTTTYDAAAYAADGTARARVTLPAELFDGTVNVPVMHQAVKAYLANQRQANAHTKNRKHVTGGNQKPWKQKGTGRARQGSTRAPHWVGGGTVFGPTSDRNYTEKVQRQVRQLARKSALNARAREEALMVVEQISFDSPKTSLMRDLLKKLGVWERKVLVLTDGANTVAHLSARNLPNVHVMPYSEASTYHILWSDVLVVESGAIGAAPAEGEAKAKAPAKKAAAKKTTAKKATAKKATKTAKSAKAGEAEGAEAEPAAKPRKRAATKKTAGDSPATEE